jgi:hypothetical protein
MKNTLRSSILQVHRVAPSHPVVTPTFRSALTKAASTIVRDTAIRSTLGVTYADIAKGAFSWTRLVRTA